MGGKKITLCDVQKLAKKRHGLCLSKKYINSVTKMKWQCKEGHKWHALYNSIKSGTWCNKCDINLRKPTLRDIQKLVKQKGGKCLSKKYVDNKTKMKWQCKEGHKWNTPYRDIKNRGDWCRKCDINSRKNTIQDAKKLARKNNGICLSKKYTNGITKMRWQCKKGHKWDSIYHSINMGSWCPKCNKNGGVEQRKLVNILNAMFPKSTVKENYRGFDWLKYKRNLELDIFIPEYKLAIEYDGKQHFKLSYFGDSTKKGSKQVLKEIQKRDRLKDKLIKENKQDIKYFVRFNYKDKITKEMVKLKLVNVGLDMNRGKT